MPVLQMHTFLKLKCPNKRWNSFGSTIIFVWSNSSKKQHTKPPSAQTTPHKYWILVDPSTHLRPYAWDCWVVICQIFDWKISQPFVRFFFDKMKTLVVGKFTDTDRITWMFKHSQSPNEVVLQIHHWYHNWTNIIINRTHTFVTKNTLATISSFSCQWYMQGGSKILSMQNIVLSMQHFQ